MFKLSIVTNTFKKSVSVHFWHFNICYNTSNVFKYIILGGNLRYEGAKQNGDQDAPCIVVPDDMSVEKMKEIVIKDNGTFGAWDFDALANEWDNLPLVDWGVPAWNTEEEPEIDDKPDLSDGIDFTYKLEIECVNESEQEQLYNELIGRGYKCRVLTL